MPSKDHLQEIEIKLYVSSQTMAKLRRFSLLRELAVHDWQQKELFNQYFDTKERALAAAKVALRIRKDGAQYIQTLKTKGQSVGGFSARNEFECPVSDASLDLNLLGVQCWPESLAALDKTKLETVFSTDFVRELILLNYQSAKDSAQIEVALDQGFIKTQSQHEAISELELELKQGSVDAMLDFAIKLAKQFPLIPSDISKSERGYRLADPESYQFSLKPKSGKYTILQQIEYRLKASQRLLESYLWQPNKSILGLWFEQLIPLNKLFNSVKAKELSYLLAVVIDAWQLVIKSNDEQLLIDQFQQEMNHTRWGVFSLSASSWLLNQC